MLIRNMETGDYEAYCALLREVHGLHAGQRPDIFLSGCPTPGEREFEDMLADENVVCLAADEGGAMAGMCIMEIRMPKAAHVHKRPLGYIDDLCVREDLRGRGIGTALYRAMRDRARDMGLVRIELMVWAFNEDARRFYGRLGMKERSSTMEDIL